MTENSSAGKIAIIAAMHREISGLVRGWQTRDLQFAGKKFRTYESPRAVVVAGGIGARIARLASQAIVNVYQPNLLISCGIAGSVSSNIRVAEVVQPQEILDLETNCRYRAAGSDGLLLSASSILPTDTKRSLAAKHGAIAVDMEAAAVAAVASANHIPVFAIKAISDDLDSHLPPLNRFIRADGSFATGAFLRHIALRPSEWRPTMSLARNTRLAIAALEIALRDLIDTQEAAASAIKSSAGADRNV